MECSEKPACNQSMFAMENICQPECIAGERTGDVIQTAANTCIHRYTRRELEGIRIEPPSEAVRKCMQENWDRVAKPLDGMGRFEALTAQIGAIQGSSCPDISRKAVIIMCADNGIVEEGVSQSGQEVTLAVVREMACGISSVGKMAAVIGADTVPVDIGICQGEAIPGVLDRKIRRGTENFLKKPAMTEEEAVRAIFTGIEMVSDCKKAGYHILATGEMGIGNTTTSSAVAAALLQCDVAEVTGRGAGLSDAGLRRKRQVIREALEKYGFAGTEGLENCEAAGVDELEVLRTVGGLDIAGLAGVCIGGAVFHVPVVLDGVISLAAALVAERILPGTKAYLLASHKGKEPAAEKLMKELGLEAVIDAGMALGEGTGAVMLFSLLDMAFSVYHNGTSFSEIQVEQYKRFS